MIPLLIPFFCSPIWYWHGVGSADKTRQGSLDAYNHHIIGLFVYRAGE